MFHPLNHSHVTKDASMCHSDPVSLCAPFNPLYYSVRYTNTTQQEASQVRTCTFRVENILNA